MNKTSNKSFEVISSVKKKKSSTSTSQSSFNLLNAKQNNQSQSELTPQQNRNNTFNRSQGMKEDSLRAEMVSSTQFQNQSNRLFLEYATTSSQPCHPLKPDDCESKVPSNFHSSKSSEKSNRSSLISTSSMIHPAEQRIAHKSDYEKEDEMLSETELLKRCMAKISAKLEREKQKRRELKEMVKRSNANLGSLQQAVSSYKLDINLVKELTVQTSRAVDSLESVRSTSRNPTSKKSLNSKTVSNPSQNKSQDRTTATKISKKPNNIMQRRHSKSVSNLAAFEMMLNDSSSSDEDEYPSLRYPTALSTAINPLNSERKIQESKSQKIGQIRQKQPNKSMVQTIQQSQKTTSKPKFPSSHGIQSSPIQQNNLFQQKSFLQSSEKKRADPLDSQQNFVSANKKHGNNSMVKSEASTSPFVSNIIRVATPQQIIAKKLLDFKNLKETLSKQIPELRKEINSGSYMSNPSMLDLSSVSNPQLLLQMQQLSPTLVHNVSADKLSTRGLSIASEQSNQRSNQPLKSTENSSNQITLPVVSQSINESQQDLIGTVSNEFCCFSEIPSELKLNPKMQLTASELINASSVIDVDASSSKKQSRRSFESDSKEQYTRLSQTKHINSESDRIESSMDLFKEQLNYFKMQDNRSKYHSSQQQNSLSEPIDRLSTLESRLYDSTIQRQLDKIYKIETPVSQHNSSPAESQNSSFAHSVSQCSTVPTASKRNPSKKNSAQKDDQTTIFEGGIPPTSLMLSSLVQQQSKDISSKVYLEGTISGDNLHSNKKQVPSHDHPQIPDSFIPPAKIQSLFYKTPAQKIVNKSQQFIQQHQQLIQQHSNSGDIQTGGISDRSQCSDRLSGTDTFSSPMMNLKSPEQMNRFRESLKNYKSTYDPRTVKESPSQNESLGLSSNQDGCGLVSMNLSESMAYSASIGSTPAKSNFYTTPNTTFLKSQNSNFAISSVAPKHDKSPIQVSTPFQNEKQQTNDNTEFITPQKKQR